MRITKDPFQTLQRVAIPWANIDKPTRVIIGDVQPGSLDDVYHGQTITVSATVQGTKADETVTLVYQSVDGQIVDQRVPMQKSESSRRYEVNLPALESGIQLDLEYYLEAGDARTPSYRVRVIPAPSIWIDRVEYEYPKYTKIPPRTVARQGDVEAIEGTRVTLYAETNQAIQRATLALADDNNPAAAQLRMTAQKQTAKLPLLLELNEERTAAKYSMYRLKFTTPKGLELSLIHI